MGIVFKDSDFYAADHRSPSGAGYFSKDKEKSEESGEKSAEKTAAKEKAGEGSRAKANTKAAED